MQASKKREMQVEKCLWTSRALVSREALVRLAEWAQSILELAWTKMAHLDSAAGVDVGSTAEKHCLI